MWITLPGRTVELRVNQDLGLVELTTTSGDPMPEGMLAAEAAAKAIRRELGDGPTHPLTLWRVAVLAYKARMADIADAKADHRPWWEDHQG